MKERKLLIFSTLVLLVISAWIFQLPKKTHPISIDTDGQMTIGVPSAPVHLVLFEEFACVQCKRFHVEDFPVIFERYIETGKVRVTVIPEAFLDASLVPFAGYLTAARVSGHHAKAFLDYVFSLSQEITLNELLTQYASRHADFHPTKALDSDEIEVRREANRSLITEETIEMPTVIVNGHRVRTICLKEICQKIEEELAKL